jgi:hypothetical protein
MYFLKAFTGPKHHNLETSKGVMDMSTATDGHVLLQTQTLQCQACCARTRISHLLVLPRAFAGEQYAAETLASKPTMNTVILRFD